MIRKKPYRLLPGFEYDTFPLSFVHPSLTQVRGTARNFRDSPEEAHKRGIKNVVSVQQTGYGCHKIFSATDYRSVAKEIHGNNMIVLAEEGFTKTKIM